MALHTFWKVICIGDKWLMKSWRQEVSFSMLHHLFRYFLEDHCRIILLVKTKLTCHSRAYDIQEHRHEVIKGCYVLGQKTIKPPWISTQFLWSETWILLLPTIWVKRMKLVQKGKNWFLLPLWASGASHSSSQQNVLLNNLLFSTNQRSHTCVALT